MSVTEQQRRYLDAMGIPVWLSRDNAILSDADDPDSGVAVLQDDSMLGWETLQPQVTSCTRCDLHKTRTQTVFGTGSHNAHLLVIGEAPGADEDRQGEPFVGRAGKLLNEMLRAIGLQREKVYIANILKCRPPDNRDPRPDEVICCEPWLQQQIALLQPKVILAVGRIAAQNLLKSDVRIGAMRGQRYSYGENQIPVVVTYHPAYLLRSPKEKRKAWEDLKLVLQYLA